MTEDQFLKTMIETIKYDDYEKKEEMLTILRNSRPFQVLCKLKKLI